MELLAAATVSIVASWWQIVTITAIAALGLIYMRSEVVKSRVKEATDLAATRGEKIDDLKDELARQRDNHEAEVFSLRERIGALEARVDALMAMKGQEIAEKVVEGLMPFLGMTEFTSFSKGSKGNPAP